MNPYTEIICGSNGDAMEVTNVATSTARDPAEWFDFWVTGGKSDAGVAVTGYTSLTHCPLWQGVNIIAGDIGQVPIRLVRNVFDDQKKHPAWNLLRVEPNGMQTPSVWKETMMQWALIWGNGVSWIRRRGATPIELIPLRPDCLRYELVGTEDSQVMLYHYTSLLTGDQYTFFPDDVIHIQGLTGDGYWGYPLWQIARNTIGHGLALEKHGNKSFSNGARPSGVLEHPGKLSPEAVANLRREWDKVHGGAENSGRIAILWEAMKFNPISMTNIDAQWLEAKKLNRVDCASLLNLPAHKLNALEDSSVRSNLEEQNEVYKQMTLTRWANRFNEEFKRKLLKVSEWHSDEYEFVFDWDAFMRADIETLANVANTLVHAELMNRNEARRTIRLPPYEGGEKFGSPAINPSNESDAPVATPAKKVEKDDSVMAEANKAAFHKARDAAARMIAKALVRERSVLSERAKGGCNFIQWLDSFYGRDDVPNPDIISVLKLKLANCSYAGVGRRQKAEIVRQFREWSATRREQLMSIASSATKAQLPGAVAAMADYDPTTVAAHLVHNAIKEPETWD